MKSVLEKLYNGEIIPIEQYRPMLEEHRIEFLKKEKQFSEQLSEEQKKQLEILMDDYLNLFPIEMVQEFSNGFKLGVQLMCEVFSEDLNVKKREYIIKAVQSTYENEEI